MRSCFPLLTTLGLLLIALVSCVRAQSIVETLPLDFAPLFSQVVGPEGDPEYLFLFGSDKILRYSFQNNVLDNFTVDAQFWTLRVVAVPSVPPKTARMFVFVGGPSDFSTDPSLYGLNLDNGTLYTLDPNNPAASAAIPSNFAIETYEDYVVYLVPFSEGVDLLSVNLNTFEILNLGQFLDVSYVGERLHRSGDGLYFSYTDSNRLFWTNGTMFREASFGPFENTGWVSSTPRAISPTQTAWVGYMGFFEENVLTLHVALCEFGVCNTTSYDVSSEGLRYRLLEAVAVDQAVIISTHNSEVESDTRVIDFSDDSWYTGFRFVTPLAGSYPVSSHQTFTDPSRPWDALFVRGWDDGTFRFRRFERTSNFDLEPMHYFGSNSNIFSEDGAESEFWGGPAEWVRTSNELILGRAHQSIVSQRVLFLTEHTSYSSKISLRLIFNNETTGETTSKVVAVLHDCVHGNRKGFGIRAYAYQASTDTTFLVTDSSEGNGIYAYSHADGTLTLVTRLTQARVLRNNEAVVAVNGIGSLSPTTALVAVYTSNYRVALVKISALSDTNIPTFSRYNWDLSDESCSDFYPAPFRPTVPLNDQFSLLYDYGWSVTPTVWLVKLANNSVHNLAEDVDIGGGLFERRAISVDRGRGGSMIGASRFALLSLGADDTFVGRVLIFSTSSHLVQNATVERFDFPLQEVSPLALNTPSVPLDWLLPIRTSSSSSFTISRFQAFLDGSYTMTNLYVQVSQITPHRTSEAFFSTYDNRVYQVWGDAEVNAVEVKKRAWPDTYPGPTAMTLGGTVEFLPMQFTEATVMPFATLVNSTYFVFVEKNGTVADAATWSLHLSVYDITRGATFPLLTLCSNNESQSCTWLERRSNVVPIRRKRAIPLTGDQFYVSNPICGNLADTFTFFAASSEGTSFQLGSVNLQSRQTRLFPVVSSSLEVGEMIGLKGMKCFPGANGRMYIVTTAGVYSSDGTDVQEVYPLPSATSTNNVEESFLLGSDLLFRIPTTSVASTSNNVRFLRLSCVGNLCGAPSVPPPVRAPINAPVNAPTSTNTPASAPTSTNTPVAASQPPSAAVSNSGCRGQAPFRTPGLPKAVCINGVWVFAGNIDIDRFRRNNLTKPIELEFPQKVRFEGNFRIRRRRRRVNLVPVASPIGAAPMPIPVASPILPPLAAPVAAPIAAPVSPPLATPVAAPIAAPINPPLVAPVAAPIASPIDVGASPFSAPELPDVDPSENPTIVLTSINETHTILGCAEFSGTISISVKDSDLANIKDGAKFELFTFNGNCESTQIMPPSNSTETTFDGIVIDYGGLTNPAPLCLKNNVVYDERSMAIVFASDAECNAGVGAGLSVGAQVGIAFAVIAVALLLIFLIFRFRKRIVPSYRSSAGLKKMRSKVSSVNNSTSADTRSSSVSNMSSPTTTAYAPVPAPAPAPAVAPAAAAVVPDVDSSSSGQSESTSEEEHEEKSVQASSSSSSHSSSSGSESDDDE